MTAKACASFSDGQASIFYLYRRAHLPHHIVSQMRAAVAVGMGSPKVVIVRIIKPSGDGRIGLEPIDRVPAHIPRFTRQLRPPN